MDAATETVELAYTMTANDIFHGVRARSRSTRAGRVALMMLPVAAVSLTLALVVYVVLAIAGEFEPGLVLALVAIIVLGLFVALQRRIYGQLATRMGNVRASIDDENVRIANENTSSVSNWSAYGSYVETGQAFVLLSPDKRRIQFTVLPKRGLANEADVRRLREILARHLG